LKTLNVILEEDEESLKVKLEFDWKKIEDLIDNLDM
jgi:hypothetical protein